MTDYEKLNKALVLAAQNKDLSGVRAALEAGADPNAQASAIARCWTALHFAAGAGAKEMVEILIEAGASLGIRDHSGCFPLDIALQFGRAPDIEDFCVWLAGVRRSAAAESECAVGYAAERGYGRLLHVLIEEGFPYSKGGSRGASPLESAALAGSVECVAKMIELGSHIDTPDRYGHTALHTAANFRHLELAKWLISAGANLSAVQNAGYTPLHTTGLLDAADVAELLLRSGADPTALNKSKQTPFRTALHHGAPGVMIALEAAGFGEPMGQDALNSRLGEAAKAGHTSMVVEMLRRGADPMFRPHGKTLLQYAKKEAAEIKQIILAARAGTLIDCSIGAAPDVENRTSRAASPSL